MEHIRTVLYNQSTLTFDKTKRKWYVLVTVPTQLVGTPGFKNKQIKRSTGTSDEAHARKLQHQITGEIYRSFSNALKKEQFVESKKFFAKHGIRTDVNEDSLMEFLEAAERLRVTNPLEDWDNGELAMKELEAALHEQNAMFEPETDLRTVASLYFEQRKFTNQKTKSSAETHVNDFITLVGNIDINEVQKKHGYDLCKALEAKGQANKTIKTKLSSVSGLLYWCEQEGIISATPFNNMKTSNFGRSSEHYKVIPKEITKAFWNDTRVGEQERLMLACLYFTGCRIDEWATATYEMIGSDPQGFRFLDLREADVKNNNSKRMIPLHPFLNNLLGSGSGRIFDYTIDANGKATNSASKAFMKHLKAHTSDPKHVAHSYRHGLKDMLRDSDVSKELNDFITGHSSGDVAGDYGSGPSLEKRYEALVKIEQDVFS